MARLKPPQAEFDDRLTLTEHLDELRNRIIVSLVAFGAAFALCFWQNPMRCSTSPTTRCRSTRRCR